MKIEFEGTVRLWPANEKFFLLGLPKDLSADIFEISDGLTNGWGSLKVEARLGTTVWRTSIFPDTKLGIFELPLKAEVRKKNDLYVGSVANCEIELLGF
jgi:Domain of unknown function (DUF1905)